MKFLDIYYSYSFEENKKFDNNIYFLEDDLKIINWLKRKIIKKDTN